MKVAAQGLVEYALIVGKGERVGENDDQWKLIGGMPSAPAQGKRSVLARANLGSQSPLSTSPI